MTCRAALLSLLFAGALLAAELQVIQKDAPPGAPMAPPLDDRPVVLRLAPQAAKAPVRLMEWSFQADELDRTTGNAAQLWLRAGATARGVRHKWTEAEDNWLGSQSTPLKDLPRMEVRALLDKFAPALRQAEQASLRTQCDWANPPLTIQSLADFPYDDIQVLRELIRLVSLRSRLALAEGRFEDCHADLRIGLTMSRHVGTSDHVIQDLVAIALGAIMLGRVDEWVQTPGSPNLYWALTELPQPLIDVRRAIRSEMNVFYRSFPLLRDFKTKNLSQAEAQALVDKAYATFGKLAGEVAPGWMPKLTTTAMVLLYRDAAKKELIARGRSEKEVNAMPAVQAVVLNHLEEYDRGREEVLKCLMLPPWECLPALEKVEKAERKRAKEKGDALSVLFANQLPATVKVYHAFLRTERNVAGLRAAEALRLHVAKHGRPPAKWADITEVPLPVDPITGKKMDEWYAIKGGKAVLEVPPPPGMPKRLGKRYEVLVKES